MLIRSNRPANPEKIFNDAMYETPTLSRSIYDSFASSIAAPIVAINALDSTFGKEPEGKAILNQLEAINMERQAPNMGWGQWLADEGASMLGYGLNPLTWILGETGGLIAKGATNIGAKGLSKVLPTSASIFMRQPLTEVLAQPISRYLPEKIGKEGAEKTLSAALLTEKTISAFGVGVGAGVPQGIVDNFNRDTGNINWGGVARESVEMGAFGVAIGSIPFAIGIIRSKIRRNSALTDNTMVSTGHLHDALEKGQITQKEYEAYQAYLDYAKEPYNEELKLKAEKLGSEIISDNGQKVNTVTNEALFDILTGDDVSNLHGVIADELASAHLPEAQRNALSNYIIHNRLDYIRKNPQSLDGLRGYVEFVNDKLSKRIEQTEKANKILESHLMRSVKENMPFSQKELFKMMKRSGFEESHALQIPVTIPDNVLSQVKFQRKLNKLKSKIKKEKRLGKEPNKQTLQRITDLEGKSKILTPKEELQYLKDFFLSEKGLPNNFQTSKEYHRLLDLSHVWKNAETLLDRIHLEQEYNRQQVFRDMVQGIIRIADSDQPALARPENVLDYLKARSERLINKVLPENSIVTELKDFETIPADADVILAENEKRINAANAPDMKKEFIAFSEKYKEFKGKQNVFQNFISCLVGGLNG